MAEDPKNPTPDDVESDFDTDSEDAEEAEEQIDTPRPKYRAMAGMEFGSKSILNITNLAVLTVLVGLILFVLKIISVFGIFIFSFVIAFLLFPMVDWLNERRIPRTWAILIVYAVIGVVLFGFFAAIVPATVKQANSFIEAVPGFVTKFKSDLLPQLEQHWITLQGFGVTVDDIEGYLTDAIPMIQGWLVDLGQGIANGVQGAVGGIVTLLTVPIIVFYLLLDGPRIRESLMKFAPPRTATEAQSLLNKLAEMLNHYLRGQLKLSFYMFVITTTMLTILGVEHALMLGVIAGLTEVIPIIGPIIALIPALFSSYFLPCDNGLALLGGISTNWLRMLIVFISYMILQWFEGNIMVPKIMGKDLNLHPLTVMFALLAGGYLAGVFGMLLGLPIAASLKVVFETYYPPFIQRVEDLLRRQPSNEPDVSRIK